VSRFDRKRWLMWRRSAIALVFLIGVSVTYVSVKSYRAAAAAANYSCLASLHANLSGRGAFDRASSGPDWREWTDAEVALALSDARPTDCAGRGCGSDVPPVSAQS
jgi:hypothetical protein